MPLDAFSLPLAEPAARDLGWKSDSTSSASSSSSASVFGLAHLKSLLCFALAAIYVPHLGAIGARLLLASDDQ